MKIIAQLINKLVRVYCSIVDHCVNEERDVIGCNDSLWGQIKYDCFHVNLNDSLCPRVDNMESRFDDLLETAEALHDPGFAGLKLEYRALTAAANAWAIYFEEAGTAATSFKARLVAGGIVLIRHSIFFLLVRAVFQSLMLHIKIIGEAYIKSLLIHHGLKQIL